MHGIDISFFSGASNVTFSFRNTMYQNNSRVTLEDIGVGDDALLCLTELTACCRPPYTDETLGNWFFPNGTRVPSEIVNSSAGLQWNFYITRGHSVVVLNRRKGGVNGIYHCEIPDALDVMRIH